MIGAIVTTGFAVLWSGSATIGSLAIAALSRREAQDDADVHLNPLFDPAIALRYERVNCPFFCHQARALWAVLILLFSYKFFYWLPLSNG